MTKVGYKATTEHKLKISNALRGKPKSASHVKNAAIESGLARKGKIYPHMFRKMPEEIKMKIALTKTGKSLGDRNWTWKDINISYRALHRWVERSLGKPTKCEFCGKQKTTQKSIQWANKSHKYLRDLTDWVRLCVTCHRLYDKKQTI